MKATEYNIQEEGLDRITAIGLCATLCEGGPEPDFLNINTRKQMETGDWNISWWLEKGKSTSYF